jgi:hypothetical protein
MDKQEAVDAVATHVNEHKKKIAVAMRAVVDVVNEEAAMYNTIGWPNQIRDAVMVATHHANALDPQSPAAAGAQKPPSA